MNATSRAVAWLIPVVALSACSSSDGATASSSGAPSATSSSGTSGSGTSGASGASGGTSGTNGGTSGTNGPVPGPGTSHAGCKVFPNDDAWNTDITSLPVDTALMSTIYPKMNLTRGVHPDWGSAAQGYGFPITVGNASAPVPITWTTSWGPRESDKLACPSGGGEFCYPIPLNAKIEADSDHHVLFLAKDGAPDACVVYELYAATATASGFKASSGAIFHLDSNALRPEGFTSADAAGLSIFAGLVRKEEVDRGEITHALRFTMNSSQNGYIHPATHAAGSNDSTLPPMGLRLRLKSTVADSGFTGAALVIVKAMKRYGIILADNGSDWYVSGEQADTWNMDDLNKQLGKVKGGDFEIVQTGAIVPQPN